MLKLTKQFLDSLFFVNIRSNKSMYQLMCSIQMFLKIEKQRGRAVKSVV